MKNLKKDFPIFKNNSLVYLDSGATTQRPQIVLDSIEEYYKKSNANPHRGAYDLSIESTEVYNRAREKVAKFINAREKEEIIFTKGSTEAANLLSYSLENFLEAGDEIVISIGEHHANLIPWQQVARRKKAKLIYIYLDKEGRILDSEIEEKITDKTKIVSIAHFTNTLGTINPIEKIIARAKKFDAITIVDAAQSIAHTRLDVQKLDMDFLFFSGHKMLASFGIGVLYGRREFLEKLSPFLYGGSMIEYVTEEDATFAPIPEKFEGGTQNIEGAVGLAKAIEYLENIGMDNIEKYIDGLTEYALEKLLELEDIIIYGPKTMVDRSGIISFNVRDVHSHDVSTILNSKNIAIRSGHHCAQPLMKYLKINSTCRMSLYLYNTREDIDSFIKELSQIREVMGYES